MKTLKAITEAVGNVTAIIVCVCIIGGIVIYARQHITCVDLFTTFCVVHP